MRLLPALLATLILVTGFVRAEDKPLRVFIRAGVKTHGPGQHDHPKFLEDWKVLLNERGAKTDGSLEFPTAEQLANTDVMVMYCADGATIKPEQRPYFEEFLKRGGGLVVIHDAIVASKDPEYFQQIVGGVWQNGKAKWHEGEVGVYFQDREHPVTKNMANFDADDEVYFALNILPEARVLASSFHDVFTIAPQIWAYEKDNHRALVSIPGHKTTSFALPNYRCLLLRAIAWTGKRENVDYLCKPEELASLEYPEGGPQRPEKSLEKMAIHPDFNMSLVAAEPMLNKPMNMDWDPRGRMWVAETPEYPAGKKPARTSIMEGKGYKVPTSIEDRPGRDRISILEDTNGDGVADKKSVFADDLELVTGLVFHKDGVIITQAPDIIFLRDTDGDGKCDKREVLYTGLGTGDTHAVINNPRWGYDGWIYATHGYSGGTVKSPDGTKNFGGIGSGVIRFKPDGSAIEMYSSKGGNTWGLDIAWDNEVFYTQPTSGDLLMHVVLPEYVLAKGKVGKTPSFQALIRGRPSKPKMAYKRQAYVQIDQVGRFTASAGCAIYAGGSWPEEWNYTYFTTEPTINIIHQEVVKADGATYTSEKNREEEFIAGSDYWFRPIETRIGPDGALYIIDFYNQAVVHNDTRGPSHVVRGYAVRPDRDHYYGRIWRVNHKQAKTNPVPNIEKASIAELIKTLDHPNLHVRNNAMRLLWERGDDAAAAELSKLVADNNKAATARIPALWALFNMKKLNAETLTAALNSADAAVRKNGARAANNSGLDDQSALLARLKDADARVKLEAIVSLGSMKLDKAAATALLDAYPTLKNAWAESAVVSLSKSDPILFCEGAFGLADAAAAEGLLASLSQQVANSDRPEAGARLVQTVAAQGAGKDALKIAALTALARSNKDAPWSDELKAALKALLTSDSPAVASATLPLIARWDKQNTLAEDVKGRLQKAQAALTEGNLNDEQRADLVRSMLAMQKVDASILPAVAKVLDGNGSIAFKRDVVQAMGGVPEATPLIIAALPKLPPEAVQVAVDELLKRADSSMALVDAMKAGTVKVTTLGPASIHRLRTHSEAEVGKKAIAVIEELRGPEAKEKNELLAKFTPLVSKTGDAVKGKQVFTTNCAVCHRFQDIGREVGPVLTGMGAHGPAELLVSILDPNRAVEPSFVQIVVRTKENETFDGVVVRDNGNTILLRNAAGEREIKNADIKKRTNTGISLMPAGFEALGEEALRDLLTYMCSVDQKFRVVDLSDAFTADTRNGLYITKTNKNDSLKFAKTGLVDANGATFNIVTPEKSRSGNNVIVLKGGPKDSFSGSLPQKVEAKLGFASKRLHFLGGIAGWGYPAVNEKVPVVKVTVYYAGGETEELVLKNGDEFADYIAEIDVPGSKGTRGLVKENQLRTFSKDLKKGGVIEKIVLESFANGVAPTIVAISAELEAK